MYPIVKQLHVILILVSVALFQIRYWRIKYMNQQPNTFSRIMPHVVDTMLLTAGLYLAWLADISPSKSEWFLVKIIAVILYILLGAIAMRSKGFKQWLAYFSATALVLYIMTVAHFKTPWPLP